MAFCPLCLGSGDAYQELGMRVDKDRCVLCQGVGVLTPSIICDFGGEMRSYEEFSSLSNHELQTLASSEFSRLANMRGV